MFKTLVHELHISYSHTEWYFLFLTVQLQVHTVCHTEWYLLFLTVQLQVHTVCHTEWYLLFLTVQLQVHTVYSEQKSRNTYALVNLYLHTKLGRTCMHEFHISNIHNDWYVHFRKANWFLLGPKLCLSKTEQ